MTACQILFVDDDPQRVLLDVVLLDSLAIGASIVPGGAPVTLTFKPSENVGEHIQMIELFDQWCRDDGAVDLAVTRAEGAGTLRYVFTSEHEQLVLDVAA